MVVFPQPPEPRTNNDGATSMKNFLNTLDYSHQELERLIDAALQFKQGSDVSRPLAGCSVALVFFNPSLRTRASMQVGINELGGNAVVLEPGGTSWTLEHQDGVVMDGDKTEHVAEFVRVLGRYGVAIGVRTFAAMKNWSEERGDPVLNAFAKYWKCRSSISNLRAPSLPGAGRHETIREKSVQVGRELC